MLDLSGRLAGTVREGSTTWRGEEGRERGKRGREIIGNGGMALAPPKKLMRHTVFV